jgi:hypothetical protein
MRSVFRRILNKFYNFLIYSVGKNNTSVGVKDICNSYEIHFVAPGSSINNYSLDDFYGTVIGVNFVFLSHRNFSYYLIEFSNRDCLKFIDEIKYTKLESKTFFVKGYNHPRNLLLFIKLLLFTRSSNNQFIFLPDNWLQDYTSISVLQKDDYPVNCGSTITYLPTLARYLNCDKILLSGFDFTSVYSFNKESYPTHTLDRKKNLDLLGEIASHVDVEYKFHLKSFQLGE